MPEDGIVCLDNGMYKIWFARNYRTRVANTLLLDNALATMGAGLPSAMMASMLYPERRVLAVCGDGGFMMNSQEMETAVRLGLNLVVLIVQDNAYGMIRWKQAVDRFRRLGADLRQSGFRQVCGVLRCEGLARGDRGRAGSGSGSGIRGGRRSSGRCAGGLLRKQASAGGRAARPRAGSRDGLGSKNSCCRSYRLTIGRRSPKSRPTAPTRWRQSWIWPRTAFRDRDRWLKPHERIEILSRLASLMDARREQFSRLIAQEGGKPLMDAIVETNRAIDGVRNAAEELRHFAGREIPMGLTAGQHGGDGPSRPRSRLASSPRSRPSTIR